MCDQLRAVGFMEVTMLSKPSLPADVVEPVGGWWRLEPFRRESDGGARTLVRALHSRVHGSSGGRLSL